MRRPLPLKSGLDLAPMVDVVFLLLVYFLINTTLSQTKHLTVNLPRTEVKGTKQIEAISISVLDDASYEWEGRKIEFSELESHLKKLKEAKGKEASIRILGDAEAPYQAILDLIHEVQNSGIEKFHLGSESKKSPNL